SPPLRLGAKLAGASRKSAHEKTWLPRGLLLELFQDFLAVRAPNQHVVLVLEAAQEILERLWHETARGSRAVGREYRRRGVSARKEAGVGPRARVGQKRVAPFNSNNTHTLDLLGRTPSGSSWRPSRWWRSSKDAKDANILAWRPLVLFIAGASTIRPALA